jgi:dihydrolipoamide dehydrogenase
MEVCEVSCGRVVDEVRTQGMGTMEAYDVIVIGGGTAGCNAAIRARQLGLSVICIERQRTLGGACLNAGCMPSKALLYASEIYEAARSGEHATLGIEGAPILNLARMMSYKIASVSALAKEVQSLFRKHQVPRLEGEARLAGPGKVIVRRTDGVESILQGKDIVIATGSEPIALPGVGFDHLRILDSTDALALDRVPSHLAIVGAGAIGVEVGSIWRRLGSRVTLVERLDRICPGLDGEVAEALQRFLRRQGLTFKLSTDVVAIDSLTDGVRLKLRPMGADEIDTLDAELVLIAIGRRPITAGLDLESVGLRTDSQGALPHIEHRTAATGIWVIGDATTGPMLAHKGEEEAIACAELIAGLPGHVDYSSIPSVLYTNPEVAMAGRTEEELKAAGVVYKVGRFPFAANARARICGEAEGFVKLLVDAGTNLILGAHLIGPGVGDMISELGVAMEASAICEDLARTCHPHPTRAEALRQAAMDAGGWMMQA